MRSSRVFVVSSFWCIGEWENRIAVERRRLMMFLFRVEDRGFY
jgi:hypothetical protein